MKRKEYPTNTPLVIARDEIWKTRSGRRVAILAVCAELDQPIIGLLGDDPETWYPTGQYTEFGSADGGTSGYDLVERVSEAPIEAEFFLWSNKHRSWWRPNSQGYTRQLQHAGRYQRGEAFDIAFKAGFINGNPHQLPSVIPVRIEDADAVDWFTSHGEA